MPMARRDKFHRRLTKRSRCLNPDQDVQKEFLVEGPEDARQTLLLAHGAGAPMDSPFLSRVSAGLSERGIRTVRFEFPYMARRRELSGRGRGAPDRPPVLMARWKEVVERFGGGPRVAVGGKSLGGRIASMIADEVGARGLVCLGYPFHPPADPSRLRTAHLETLRTPALIVQGTRDAFGGRGEVEGYRLSPALRVAWIEDGDHSFKPRARSGRTEAGNLAEAIAAVGDFLDTLPA
jgi:predicted alpha/beta-hydrolase family hydrolase